MRTPSFSGWWGGGWGVVGWVGVGGVGGGVGWWGAIAPEPGPPTEPLNREFVKHLRLGGAGPALVQAAEQLVCRTCARRRAQGGQTRGCP